MGQLERWMKQIQKQMDSKNSHMDNYGYNDKDGTEVQRTEGMKIEVKERTKQIEKQVVPTMDNSTSETNLSSSTTVQSAKIVESNKTNSTSEQKSIKGNTKNLLIDKSLLHKNILF